jgi:anthranilate phosphoribosyltransferase
MEIKTAINQVMDRTDLNQKQMAKVMEQVMTGQATDAQIGGFLVALRMKGETVDEVAGAAQVMRELSIKVTVDDPHLVDTCGTGGDGSGIFNVSTASAFIVAAAGAKVAKHGNRSVTSRSGSADLLEAAGVNLELTPEQVARCIEQVGVGFMFAVKHHGAMKYAIGPRKELAARTIFNVLGPLTNPAGAKHQVLGVFNRAWVRPLAEVLQRLGSEHVLVVHAADGLDEISIATPTYVAELHNGQISEYTICPEDFGMPRGDLGDLVVENAQQSLALIQRALRNEAGSASDILALNAGAAIYAADICSELSLGVAMAQDLMSSGQAEEKFREFIQFTQLVAQQDN